MSKYPQGKYDRHPLNAPGPFYVEDGQCINCLGPRDLAPDLVGFFEAPPGMHGCSHCFIKKQPSTPEEVHRMIESMVASLCSGLRYCGDDPKILDALTRAGQSRRCDELSDDEPVTPPPGTSQMA